MESASIAPKATFSDPFQVHTQQTWQSPCQAPKHVTAAVHTKGKPFGGQYTCTGAPPGSLYSRNKGTLYVYKLAEPAEAENMANAGVHKSNEADMQEVRKRQSMAEENVLAMGT